MNSTLTNLLVQIVKDLEDTRYKYRGYAYVRTIRNILIGKDDALIAPNFKAKPYYGRLNYLTLEETAQLMDTLVANNALECIFTDHGKLYCTKASYRSS